eukprot:1142405-Pelagomonas_calceolata.AAC.3
MHRCALTADTLHHKHGMQACMDARCVQTGAATMQGLGVYIALKWQQQQQQQQHRCRVQSVEKCNAMQCDAVQCGAVQRGAVHVDTLPEGKGTTASCSRKTRSSGPRPC